MKKSILMAAVTFVLAALVFGQSESLPSLEDRVTRLEEEFRTYRQTRSMTFTESGRVYKEGSGSQAWEQQHSVVGTTKLVAGVDTVTLNTNTSEDLANVGFTSVDSYFGFVNPVNTGTTTRYTLVPISATRFCIESSSPTDTATVRFHVRGE